MAECSGSEWLEFGSQVSESKSSFFFSPSKSVYLDIICHLTRGRKKCQGTSIREDIFLHVITHRKNSFSLTGSSRRNLLEKSPNPTLVMSPTSLNASTRRRTPGLLYSPHVQDEEGDVMQERYMGQANLKFTSVKACLCWQHFYKPLTAICLIKIKGGYTSSHQVLADVEEGRGGNECISSPLLKELFQHDISNKDQPLANLKIRGS